MGTDRELLEAAAKAAGYRIMGFDDSGVCWIKAHMGSSAWNPLADDGDALRLAVKLKLVIETNPLPPQTWVCTKSAEDIEQGDWTGVSEFHHDDPYAATRRAIVRAAAALGSRHE